MVFYSQASWHIRKWQCSGKKEVRALGGVQLIRVLEVAAEGR